MNEAATHTGGDKALVYDLALARFKPEDKDRILRIALQVLTGEVDTMIVRKDFKGAGLWIKGLNYVK